LPSIAGQIREAQGKTVAYTEPMLVPREGNISGHTASKMVMQFEQLGHSELRYRRSAEIGDVDSGESPKIIEAIERPRFYSVNSQMPHAHTLYIPYFRAIE
jgi:hypothetical protein